MTDLAELHREHRALATLATALDAPERSTGAASARLQSRCSLNRQEVNGG